MSRALDFLLASQNADGGWGYKPQGMSFVEPTAAVIRVLSLDVQSQSQVQRARAYLNGTQRRDGGWGIAAVDEESGWMTAWAVWALAGGEADDRTAGQRGVDWLLRSSGIRITDPSQIEGVEKVLHIDATITGWAWQSGDAAWIFPTALTLMALDAMGVRDHPRVKEGVQYLLDRAIATGGWNIGNPFMVTGSMPPTVENTALTLMALRTLGIENDVTKLAAQWLGSEHFTGTAYEWAWRAWFWNWSKVSPARGHEELQKLQRADGSWDGNPLTTAIAVMALGVS